MLYSVGIKSMENTKTYFYKDKPIFGLDIGFNSVKVMQSRPHGKHRQVLGYGVGGFDSSAIKDSVILKHELIASAIHDVFEKHLIGTISTKRVALSIPASRTYTRTMNLPLISDSELPEAVRLEAEQYIPVPLDDLYFDYQVIERSEKGIELLAVATPKKIVDSHMELAAILGLEPIAFDASIEAAGRLFHIQGEANEIPAVLVDFGSVSADLTIYDNTSIVTGTIPCGGDMFTDLIAKKLSVNKQEAHLIKSKYGIGKSKKQSELLDVIGPELNKLVREVKRMIRYYEERSGSTKKIGQVVTMGGGANMPGVSDYLTSSLRLPVRMCDPWRNFMLNKLQPPSNVEKSLYMTVAGLSLMEPKELFS